MPEIKLADGTVFEVFSVAAFGNTLNLNLKNAGQTVAQLAVIFDDPARTETITYGGGDPSGVFTGYTRLTLITDSRHIGSGVQIQLMNGGE